MLALRARSTGARLGHRLHHLVHCSTLRLGNVMPVDMVEDAGVALWPRTSLGFAPTSIISCTGSSERTPGCFPPIYGLLDRCWSEVAPQDVAIPDRNSAPD